MRLLLAFTFALFLAAPVAADDIVYWPATGQRVYVVDIENIGVYGKITKPRGIDVIVVRHNGKWGVLPPSQYNSAPRTNRGGMRFNTQLPNAGYKSTYGKPTPYISTYGK